MFYIVRWIVGLINCGADMRIEKDHFGEKEIDEKALYGINSIRAKENFPDSHPFPIEWYKGVGSVKLAMYRTTLKYQAAIKKELDLKGYSFRSISDDVLSKLISAAEEIIEGKYFEHFIVPGISGGAGTSINMNINEIIANVALGKCGNKPGDYEKIDPIEDANIYQSTNDVIPTALRIAALTMLQELEEEINQLRLTVENCEKEGRDYLRIAYTQLQAAVPTSFGRLFSTYSDALSRDWWRISKCVERLKVINLGGSAVGTGITVPRYIIFETVNELQQITGLPLTRSENLADATSNLDTFVEVHAVLKSLAVNMEKISSDLRLLSSDLAGDHKIINIPQKQIGSSIMPGKVNPVIPEFIISASHRIYSNDQLVTSLCGQSMFELNAYLPIIGLAMLESIKLLIGSCHSARLNLLTGLEFLQDKAATQLFSSPVITTALVPHLGYHHAAELAKMMAADNCDIFELNVKMKFMTDDELRKLLKPQNLLRLGYSVKEIVGDGE